MFAVLDKHMERIWEKHIAKMDQNKLPNVEYTTMLGPTGVIHICAIERGVGGTHADYNVLYNSQCEGEWFFTTGEAMDRASTIVRIKQDARLREHQKAEQKAHIIWLSNQEG